MIVVWWWSQHIVVVRMTGQSHTVPVVVSVCMQCMMRVKTTFRPGWGFSWHTNICHSHRVLTRSAWSVSSSSSSSTSSRCQSIIIGINYNSSSLPTPALCFKELLPTGPYGSNMDLMPVRKINQPGLLKDTDGFLLTDLYLIHETCSRRLLFLRTNCNFITSH